ncbi:hypothetical protein [uncultured Legionella sp.]|uniref:hypothetical protein n=1 Tax=uncultured Legionella sp. TaxID=210934 RepID=UPI00261081F0|nr:hypothetical protein [uncultured Legionella sp.]
MDSKFERQPFTVTMLGSLTDFTPELKQIAKPTPYTKGSKVKDFPKGETLSVIASLIKSDTPAKIIKADTKNPYPLQSDAVAVINGPNMDGSNVGEKIALGLAVILKAIARGKTIINIIAHSRGTVEAILIAHELETIQKISASCVVFDEILKQLTEQQTKRYKGTPTNNTPDIIEPLKVQINQIPKEEQEQWFNALKIYLPDTIINLFGTDPVPGDCFPITWYDERYFLLPEIIKNTELIYYANEHSDWGFTPILPEVASKEKQHLVCYSMPGHHGTGSSGNNGSQQNTIVSPDGYKTTHVQKLMVYKIFRFLSNQHVEFNDGTQIFHRHTALGRKYSGHDAETKSIDIAALDFPTILRTLYAAIDKNQIGYDAYNTTNYSYMGLTKQRRIMHKKRLYGIFNDVFTPSSGYVNEEHALLMQQHFFKLFSLDNNTTKCAEMLNTASSVLEEHISKIANKEASILDSEANRKTVLEAFSIVIRQVSQQYLADDWCSVEKQQEKETLYLTIVSLLTKFKQFSVSEDVIIQQFAAKFLLFSMNSINHTLVLRSKDLEKDITCLQESIDNRLTYFFSSLLMRLNHSENNPFIILDAIKRSEEYKKLANHPSSIKINYIYNGLAGKGLETYSIEELTRNYEELFANTLEDFAKLYQQIQLFIVDLSALCTIAPSEKIEIDEPYLRKQANELIVTAAERFYKDRSQELPPVAETEGFMRLAEQHAIEHFGVIDRRKGMFSRTLSFFWNPVSEMIYGAPVNNAVNGETHPNEETTLLPLNP